MNGLQVVAFGQRHPHSHSQYQPFSNFVLQPEAKDIHESLLTLGEIKTDLLLFRHDTHLDDRIKALLHELRDGAKYDIVFLSDCEENLVAPRHARQLPDYYELIQVVSICCFGAVWLSLEYAKELAKAPNYETLVLRVDNDLRVGDRRGVRVFPQLAFCTPYRPHEKTVVNMVRIRQSIPWSGYFGLAMVALFVLIILIAVIVIIIQELRRKRSPRYARWSSGLL